MIKIFFKTFFIFLPFYLYCIWMNFSFDVYFYISILSVFFFELFICWYLLNINMRTRKSNLILISNLKKLGFKKFDSYPIYYSDNNMEYVYATKLLFDSVAEYQKAMFIKKGFIIIIGFQKELNKINKERNIVGLFKLTDKYISLYVNSSFDKNKLEMQNFTSNFYHEWGHFIDYLHKFPSEKIKFYRVYRREKENYKNKLKPMMKIEKEGIRFQYLPYYLKNQAEFFAVNYDNYKREIKILPSLKEYFYEIDMKN